MFINFHVGPGLFMLVSMAIAGCISEIMKLKLLSLMSILKKCKNTKN